MRKATTKKFGGTLLAASLAMTLAAFGCTSNQYAGNGQPTSVTPTINTVNHSGTTGSSSGTEGLPPMSSSYVNPAAPRVDVDALATLAAEQGFRGRVLGPVSPEGYLPGVTIATGQFVSPANQVLPQYTVNSSINSQPTPVITGGDVGVGVTLAAAGTTTIGGTTAALGTTTTGATTATTAGTAATGTTPVTGALTTATAGTVASSASFSPVLMNSTPAPQATGTVNRTLPTVVATGRATTPASRTAASTARSTTASSTVASRTATATTNVNVVSGIQIQTGANGAIMVTNVANTAPTVKGK